MSKKSLPTSCRKMRVAICLVILTLTLSLRDVSLGAIIYRQTFGATIAGYEPFGNFGWSAYRSSNNGNVTDVMGSGYYYGGFESAGMPANLPNINAPASANQARGFARFWNADNMRLSVLAYTSQYTIDRSAFELGSISWWAAGKVGGTLRAALQIGGTWYVSDAMGVPQLLNDSTYNFDKSAVQYTLDFDTAQWYSLTASVGSPFVIGGTPLALPAGDVTAFGMYAVPNTDNNAFLMFDTYEISASAVPEPGTYVAMLLGAGLVFCRRNTTKRALKG